MREIKVTFTTIWVAFSIFAAQFIKMKKCLVVLLVLSISVAQAQKTVAKKPVHTIKSETLASGMKNLTDSVSYAIGLQVAKFYSQQGIKSLNASLVAKGIADVYGNKPILLTDAQANDAVMHLMNPNLTKNIETGEKFLEQNKNKPGVVTTASGLQYEVLTQGTGPKPGAADTVVANYKGTLLDGTEFDNSYKRNEPLTIQVNRVIPGWTEALQLMPVGSKYKLYVPYKLAYGPNDNGPIPGGSMLVFEVELLSIKGK